MKFLCRSHRSVDDGDGRPLTAWKGGLPCGAGPGTKRPCLQGPRRAPDPSTSQRACLTLAVNSCTRLYTDRSSRINRAILEVAWITVVWSRPPNCFPIFGRDESVSSRERYIATCRG